MPILISTNAGQRVMLTHKTELELLIFYLVSLKPGNLQDEKMIAYLILEGKNAYNMTKKKNLDIRKKSVFL